jgi:hypothetical protein
MEDPAPYYATDEWNGLPHYVCPACGYDSLLLARMADHEPLCQALARERATASAPLDAEPALDAATGEPCDLVEEGEPSDLVQEEEPPDLVEEGT